MQSIVNKPSHETDPMVGRMIHVCKRAFGATTSGTTSSSSVAASSFFPKWLTTTTNVVALHLHQDDEDKINKMTKHCYGNDSVDGDEHEDDETGSMTDSCDTLTLEDLNELDNDDCDTFCENYSYSSIDFESSSCASHEDEDEEDCSTSIHSGSTFASHALHVRSICSISICSSTCKSIQQQPLPAAKRRVRFGSVEVQTYPLTILETPCNYLFEENSYPLTTLDWKPYKRIQYDSVDDHQSTYDDSCDDDDDEERLLPAVRRMSLEERRRRVSETQGMSMEQVKNLELQLLMSHMDEMMRSLFRLS